VAVEQSAAAELIADIPLEEGDEVVAGIGDAVQIVFCNRPSSPPGSPIRATTPYEIGSIYGLYKL
jgi:hypothetical protein